jgi:hypothetical protein
VDFYSLTAILCVIVALVLLRSAVIMGAEAHDIDFSHNAPSNSQKSREEQEASSYDSPESPFQCGVGFRSF